MKNDTEYHAINCRIPRETYDLVQKVIVATGKTTATTVSDAVVYYVNCVQGNLTPTKPLQIDQFAWKLHNDIK